LNADQVIWSQAYPLMDPLSHLSQYWHDSDHLEKGPVVCGNGMGTRMTHNRFYEDLKIVWYEAKDKIAQRPTVTFFFVFFLTEKRRRFA